MPEHDDKSLMPKPVHFCYYRPKPKCRCRTIKSYALMPGLMSEPYVTALCHSTMPEPYVPALCHSLMLEPYVRAILGAPVIFRDYCLKPKCRRRNY